MKFRLASVLRARKAQEDAAKAAVAKARSELAVAAVRIRTRDQALDGRRLPPTETSRAFAAALWARQALAGAVSDAISMSEEAERAAQAKVAELTSAAVRRKALEQLAERQADQERSAEEAAERAALDELASSTFHQRKQP